jgi:hypothetical protein
MATPPGYADVSVEMTHVGNPRPSFLTFGINPTLTDAAAIAADIATTLGAAAGPKTILDSEASFTAVRVSVGTDGTEDIVYESAISIVGTAPLTALPSNCAVLVHKRTARGGRRGRGRLFLPWCISEAAVDEAGIIAGATVTTLNVAMSAWHGDLSTRGSPMVLLHQPSSAGTVHPTTPGPPDVVTGLVVDNLIATQRRRLGRR